MDENFLVYWFVFANILQLVPFHVGVSLNQNTDVLHKFIEAAGENIVPL